MEDLHLEFDTKAEEDDKMKGYLPDVQQRMEHMISFKKTFLRFQLQTETVLKKVAVVPMVENPIILKVSHCYCPREGCPHLS